MIRTICLLTFIVLTVHSLPAQDNDILLNHELYHYLDRLDIKGVSDTTFHTDVRPYGRRQVAEMFQRADISGFSAREREWHRQMRVLGDDHYADTSSTYKGIFKALYKNKRDFYTLRSKNLDLYINPVLYLSGGADQHNYDTTGTDNLINYRNSRGVQLRGTAFGKIGFFTEAIETQAKYPQFIRNYYDQYNRLWGEGFVKTFDDNTDNYGFDYFSARGYITYSPVKAFRMKLGKDRYQFGNGYQSLLLSDHATDYFFLNLNTRIWKLEYVNHFAQMVDFIRNKPDGYGTHPRKYSVMHQLFYKPNDKLSFGFFESIVYTPNLPGQQRGFEIEYLNPLIFYRSVEQFLGSPDNSAMGLSAKVNFLKRFQFYGQIYLDDYNFRNRDQGTGFHANKYGLQGGLKYIDAFWVPRLDLQLEYNTIRPYAYTHFNPAANFSHYGTPLAHPEGGNLWDFHLIARYQPFPRWNLQAIFSHQEKGFDLNGDNYGGNIFRPYTTRVQDFNNVIGQGDLVKTTTLWGKVSYKIQELDAFAEVEGRYRKENDITSMSVVGSLRMNIPNKAARY